MSSGFNFNMSKGSAPASAKPFPRASKLIVTSQSVSAARRAHSGYFNSSWEQLNGIKGSTSQNIPVKIDLEMQCLESLGIYRGTDWSREDLVHL
jgi:hypothetical protein